MIILTRIRHRFRGRASEWFCAANIFSFGATLLHPSQTFVSPAYEAFRPLGEERTGALLALCGFAWIVGLVVNGAMDLVTSWVRGVCAFVGAVVYGLLAVGFAGSFLLTGFLSTGIGNYVLTSMLALYALFWIVRDRAGRA